MADVRKLLGQLSQAEESLRQRQFLAPRVAQGPVRTRVQGLVYTFHPLPPDFEGWGIFQPLDEARAQLVDQPAPFEVSAYLGLFKPVRMRLALPLGHRSWLAYPVNESDARQRLGSCQPLPVHLVDGAAALEQVVTRWDGRALWFEEVDRRSDPAEAQVLQQALTQNVDPEKLQYKGLTPEARTAYDLAFYQGRPHPDSDQRRLERALRSGGGELEGFVEQDGYYTVHWRDGQGEGESHTSAISRDDLTVLSAGICLSGEDRKFDLQSLVGVVEGADSW